MLDLVQSDPEGEYVFRAAQVDNTRTLFRYYLRTPDGAVSLTDPISVLDVHEMAKTLPEGTFIAALSEE